MRSSKDRQKSYKQSRTALQRQEQRMLLKLRMVVTYSSLALFTVYVLSVGSAVFLVGFGKMALPEKLTLAVITATAAPAAAMFAAIMRYLFPK